MNVGDSKKMRDGTIAYYSGSKKYFIRREPDEKNWDTIKYYTIEGFPISLAKGKCKKCGDILESKSCGDFTSCSCGSSFVDTDRWFPERHRYGGEIEVLKEEDED